MDKEPFWALFSVFCFDLCPIHILIFVQVLDFITFFCSNRVVDPRQGRLARFTFEDRIANTERLCVLGILAVLAPQCELFDKEKNVSADTRHKKVDDTQLGVLTKLFATAVTLMVKGKREERMVSALRHALQLFKENRLSRVHETVCVDEQRIQMQSDQSLLLDDKLAERVKGMSDWAFGKVDACITSDDPRGHWNDPMLLPAAHIVCSDEILGGCVHAKKWNIRFGVATMCGMSRKKQQVAAWCVVNSMLNDNYMSESSTLYLTKPLQFLGFLDSDCKDFKAHVGGSRSFDGIIDELAISMIRYFGLPSTFMGPREFSMTERWLREECNKAMSDGHQFDNL